MKLYYQVETIDPIVLSQTSATTNNHECLDYIPGSALLGIVASSAYSEISKEKAWDLFHSGQVKYGPGYPLLNNEIALPIPSSWHYPKGEVAFENAQLTQAISNHSTPQFKRESSVQYKQIRQGFINSMGKLATVQQGIVTKTAIDVKSQTAQDGSLYSYSYIDKKQAFSGWIDCKTEEQATTVREHLFGIKRLGRSRGSEFGRVLIQEVQAPKLPAITTLGSNMVLWCLSDCEVTNQFGLPTLTPSLADLVPGASGTLNASCSFIRGSKVSRFNQKRQGLDSEQIVIAKGSILAFKDCTISNVQLQQLSEQGVGHNKQQGLGWVAINPQWIKQDHLTDAPYFSAIQLAVTHQGTTQAQSNVNSPLCQWVSNQLDQRSRADSKKKQVTEIQRSLVQSYKVARQYNQIIYSNEAGPSSSQWRRVMDVLRYEQKQWRELLFSGDRAICKASNDSLGWGIEWDNGQQFVSFSAQCEQLFNRYDAETLLLALEQLTRYDLSRYKEWQRAVQQLSLNQTTSEVTA
ncbi:hypothetical protein AB4524_00780 [Vibrio breoganii]